MTLNARAACQRGARRGTMADMLKAAIAVLALAGSLWGCADGGDPAGRDGTGGAAAIGTGGAPATGGQSGGTIGTGGAVASGSGGGGSAGHPAATGGTTGTGGAGSGGSAGASSGTPPTCESLGWYPGSASLCGASKDGYECASCGNATGTVPNQPCVSNAAAQGAAVLCAACSSCR